MTWNDLNIDPPLTKLDEEHLINSEQIFLWYPEANRAIEGSFMKTEKSRNFSSSCKGMKPSHWCLLKGPKSFVREGKNV